MKYLTLALLFLPFIALSQQYGIKYETDEFTSEETLTSDWITLNDPVWKKGRISYIRVLESQNSLFLSLKTTTGEKAYSIDQGDFLYLKLENNEVIQLESLKDQITGVGDGAVKLRGSDVLGFDLIFTIDRDILKSLSENRISKIRLALNEGNLEVEPEKKRYKDEMLAYFQAYLRFLEWMDKKSD